VLFAAGARAVVASLWEVDDEAAALLMGRFYENLTAAEPTSIAHALREASLWLRDYTDDSGAHPFEHPIYWSGFIVLGAQ
jgi:CHAT domain-containing protein